ncbi:MAG: ribonuclease P protein component [Acidobacteria bacterium]|nr:ribonuclease P protein component [Acidobacteriota bacterium]MCB9396281.1 ribonuclease P protein component [Acidobacteriota bacterium]
MPDNRFGKSNRLRKSADFRRIYRAEKKVITPVIIFFLCQSDGAEPKLGLTVPKKVGKAVKRNRIKRRIREAFRLSKHTLGQVDVVASPRRGAHDQPFEAYLQSFALLARLLRRGILQQTEPPS